MARRIHCTNSVFELLGTGEVFQALLQALVRGWTGFEVIVESQAGSCVGS